MTDKDKNQMALSDFNLQKIDTTQYTEILKGTIQSGTNLCVVGRRGGGKTAIAKQGIASTAIDKSGETAREVYINLSVAERTDMGGYPDLLGHIQSAPTKEEKKERFVNYVLPKFFEPMIVGNRPVVALLDEVDKADPSIWAPLLEILQEKSINHKPLPNLRAAIMTGNLISEGSQRPSLPLLDRAEKYLMSADTSSFLQWAAKTNRIHPSIRAFLQDKANYLFGSNDGGGDLYAEPSPRSWENASKALFFGETNGWTKDLMNLKVSGFVGKQAGLEYAIYFEHYQKLIPLVNAIFEGQDCTARYRAEDPSQQIYAALIVCSRLASILDAVPLDANGQPTHKPDALGYVGRFLRNACSEENVLISVRTQITIDRIVRWGLDTNKDWGNILYDITNSISNSK